MGGYFGTAAQQLLQARVEASETFIKETPGACQAGRFMACDDLEAFGWDRVLALIERDGIRGFRLLPAEQFAWLRQRLDAHGCRLDT